MFKDSSQGGAGQIIAYITNKTVAASRSSSHGKSLVETDAAMQTYDLSIHPPYDPLELSNDEPY